MDVARTKIGAQCPAIGIARMVLRCRRNHQILTQSAIMSLVKLSIFYEHQEATKADYK